MEMKASGKDELQTCAIDEICQSDGLHLISHSTKPGDVSETST